MHGIVRDALVGRRFQTGLMLIFAGAAFVVAIVGVYGVTTYLVTRRLRELGIRSALGAGPRDLYRLVMSGALPPVGLAAGLAGSLVLRRVMAGVLYDAPSVEPAALALVAAAIGCAATAACLIPARRAARVDPVSVLRQS